MNLPAWQFATHLKETMVFFWALNLFFITGTVFFVMGTLYFFCVDLGHKK